MSNQNYRNHARFVPLWHFVTSLSILVLMIGSIISLVRTGAGNLYSASLLLVSLVLLSIFWYARSFALRAQDRAICQRGQRPGRQKGAEAHMRRDGSYGAELTGFFRRACQSWYSASLR